MQTSSITTTVLILILILIIQIPRMVTVLITLIAILMIIRSMLMTLLTIISLLIRISFCLVSFCLSTIWPMFSKFHIFWPVIWRAFRRMKHETWEMWKVMTKLCKVNLQVLAYFLSIHCSSLIQIHHSSLLLFVNSSFIIYHY